MTLLQGLAMWGLPATVMGNSVAQWDRAYDLGMRSRETQAAVDAMPAWRQAMLTRSSRVPSDARVQAAQEVDENDSYISC